MFSILSVIYRIFALNCCWLFCNRIKTVALKLTGDKKMDWTICLQNLELLNFDLFDLLDRVKNSHVYINLADLKQRIVFF